jgi:hypothetical protein
LPGFFIGAIFQNADITLAQGLRDFIIDSERLGDEDRCFKGT